METAAVGTGLHVLGGFALSLLMVVGALGCAGSDQTPVVSTASSASDRATGDGRAVSGPGESSNAGRGAGLRPWDGVHNWVYWLDGPDPAEIGRSSFELAVIDYSADGSAAGEFSAYEIADLREAGCSRRVVAYLSIGEAEDYRFYWQSGWRPGDPGWLVSENPDWEGNYLVRFWEAAWQELVYRYLDRIIEAGFDGVYLDRVDAYADPHARGREAEMVAFVLELAAYARERSPLGDDFGVFVQNAEELGARHPDYVEVLTGIGREETYVLATDVPTPEGERREIEADLDRIAAGSRGGLVLTVDYATRPDLIDAAYERSRARGYAPYVADVDLDGLRIDPGHEPECRPF